ncbi:MAG: phosphate signaling complex protein PhoU [Planctomycetes bacterium]|nr:phosphate signaling complex protein PhoU [Planctomycetota bacterium]
MPIHLHKDIEILKKKILSLSAAVEESVLKALESFINQDPRNAVRVIRADTEIDCLEIEVEEYCLQILALNQPVAIDLRFIIAVLKMNNDLERIGDLAVNIAQQTVFLGGRPWPEIPQLLHDMASATRSMLKKSLDALVNLDTDLSKSVLDEDDQVDQMLREMYGHVKEKIAQNPSDIECLMSLLLVSRHLERIADLSTNIAEDVIYMIDGEIVRHGEGSAGRRTRKTD